MKYGNATANGPNKRPTYNPFPMLPTTPVVPDTSTTPSTKPTTGTTSSTVESDYKAQMEAANKRLEQAYQYQQQQLEKARNDALRESYIKQQMVERGYPEQLSAAGINGGAAQALLARNNADYAKLRGAVQGQFLDSLGEAGQAYQQGVLQNNENFLANMAAYRQAVEQMEREFEMQRQLEKEAFQRELLAEHGIVSGTPINGNYFNGYPGYTGNYPVMTPDMYGVKDPNRQLAILLNSYFANK